MNSESESDNDHLHNAEISVDGQPHDEPLRNGKILHLNKSKLKICRHFCYSLISNAITAHKWEDQEIGQLIFLVADQLGLTSTNKVMRLLENSSSGTPGIIAYLSNESNDSFFQFSTDQIITLLKNSSSNKNRLIQYIDEALECDLFTVSDTSVVQELSNIFDDMDDSQVQSYTKRLAKVLCEHCHSKRQCGRVLNTFTLNQSDSDAASFIFDFIELDFFLDLEGKMDTFMFEIRDDVSELLDELLSDSNILDENGEVVESDADSKGDLRGFIDDDCDDSNDNSVSSPEKHNKNNNNNNNNNKKRKRIIASDTEDST